MDLFKGIIELIVSGASRTDVDIIVSLLIFYLAVAAALFLVRIIRGFRS